MCYSLNKSRQNGTALLVSMILLLVMTMIILQGARSSNLEVLIGSNSEYTADALARAESSAEAGEKIIERFYGGAPASDYGVSESDGVFIAGQIAVDSIDWSGLNYSSSGGYVSDGESYPDINFHITEYLGPSSASGGSMSVGAGVSSDTRYLYRVSGRGESTRGGARVIQTIYATAE
jgi:Tfp pilus assembly protein PilX